MRNRRRRLTAMLLAVILMAGLLPPTIPSAGAISDDPIDFSRVTVTKGIPISKIYINTTFSTNASDSIGTVNFTYAGNTDVGTVKNMAKFSGTTIASQKDYSVYYIAISNWSGGYKDSSYMNPVVTYYTVLDLPVSESLAPGDYLILDGYIQMGLKIASKLTTSTSWTEKWIPAEAQLQVLIDGNPVYSVSDPFDPSKTMDFFNMSLKKKITEDVSSIQLKYSKIINFSAVEASWIDYRSAAAGSNITSKYDLYIKHDGVFSAQPATHANWTAEYYLQNVDGTGYYLDESVVTNGAIGADISIPDKTYTGFDKVSAGSVTSGKVTESGAVLKQYYDRKQYTLSVNGTSSDVLWGKTVYQPVSPSRPGYTFAGWMDGSNYVTFPITITDNLSLTPSFIPNSTTIYKVEHYLQEAGGGYSLHETQVLFNTTDTTATAAPKDYIGYHENTGHASRKASGTISGDGSLVLKLYYDLERYTATFCTNGGSAIPAQSNILYGQKITQPEAPTRPGYDFGGWFSNAACTVPYSFASTVGSDVSLYALWLPRDDTVYHIQHYKQSYSDPGQYVLADTDTLESTTGVYVNATRSIREYEGYHQNMAHPDRIVTAQLNGDGSTLLKVYYDVDKFQISWQENGGTGVPIQTILYGNTVAEPATPSRTYYNFVGWCTDAALEHPYDFSRPVTAGMTLYAKWTPAIPYTTQYYRQTPAQDGYDLYDTVILNGLPGEPVTAVVQDYYGFQTVHPASENLFGSIAEDGSLLLKVYYDRIMPHITIGDEEANLPYGEEISEPTADPKPGYIFSGWEDEEGDPVTFPLVVGEDDLNIHPIYTAREDTPYTVQYWLEDETEDEYSLKKEAHFTGTTDASVSLDVLSYNGYELVEDMSTLDGQIDPEDELVLKAYYRRLEYKVNVNGVNQWVRYGLPATEPTDPVRHGYFFQGYTINSGRYMDAEGNTHRNGSLWDWSTKVSGDVELLESWAPDTHVEYKVFHYVQDTSLDAHSYPELWKSETNYGETDTIVTATYADLYGFTPNPDYGLTHNHASLAGDGSTELRLYYTRNSYQATVLGRNGETLVDDTFVYETDVPPQTVNEVKAGYDWSGWKDTDGHPVTWPHKVIGNVTIHPTWRARGDTPYQVEVWAEATDDSGYQLVQTINETYTTDLTVDYHPSLTGMTGYHLNDGASSLVGVVVAEGEGFPLLLRAYYDRNPITVNINGQEREVKFGDVIPEPDTPERDGYDFLGWFDDNTGEQVEWPLTVENADRDIHPAFAARMDTVYHIHHYEQDVYDDEYTLVDTHTLHGTTDTLATVIYDCDEHFHHVDEAHQVLSGIIEGDGSLMLEAYYDRNLYDVTVDDVTETYRYEYEVEEPETPIKTGYLFTGWASDDFAPGTPIFPLTVQETVEIHSTWVPDPNTQYRVEHYWQTLDKSGYALHESAIHHGETFSTVTAQPMPYPGMTLTSTPETLSSGVVSTDSLLVLRLYYDRENVTVNINGSEQEVVAGTPIDRHPDPDPADAGKTGYDFGGWADEDGSPILWPLESYEDVNILPVWVPWSGVAYKVEYYWAELDTPGAYTLHEAVPLTAHTDEVVTADVDRYPHLHLCAGHGANLLSAAVAYDGSTVLKVYLDRDTLSVTLPDGSVLEVPYGSAVEEPDTPENPGYEFLYWKKPDGTPAEFPLDVLDSLELTPCWQPAANTPYSVEHWYWRDTTKGFYLTEIEHHTGITESEVFAEIRKPEAQGWTFDTENTENVLSGRIAGDGNLVLKVYYKQMPRAPAFPYYPPWIVTPPAKESDPSEDVNDPSEGDSGQTGEHGHPTPSPFGDVAPDSWYAEAVNFAYANGIVLGTGNGDFSPDAPTTRAMAVTLLWRLEGQPEAEGYIPFDDVPGGTWYTDAVRWAVAEGIIYGCTARTFCPDDAATREQMATILYRYRKADEPSFDLAVHPDAGQISGWARSGMRWACSNGFIRGRDDGLLHPKERISRAETVVLLYRLTTS